jgi:hypothetical protein
VLSDVESFLTGEYPGEDDTDSVVKIVIQRTTVEEDLPITIGSAAASTTTSPAPSSTFDCCAMATSSRTTCPTRRLDY